MADVLGKQVAAPRDYSPHILEAIDRSDARSQLPPAANLTSGHDVWHLYELSWLDTYGLPVSFVGVLTIPASSAATVESKSLKLYLNALNFKRFASSDDARDTICHDLKEVVGSAVELALWAPEDLGDITMVPEGTPIDFIADDRHQENPQPLSVAKQRGTFCYVSHCLRSLCPVTGQPDWATLVVRYEGQELSSAGLAAYVGTYREHQGFHESCLEKIFVDLISATDPTHLAVTAYFQRRGGIDITPHRSTRRSAPKPWRMGRQ